MAASTEVDMDDEYAQAGVKDPKILLTTARDPSSRLAQFAKVTCKRLVGELIGYNMQTGTDFTSASSKEMRLVFPNATRINRGGTVMREMSEACRANDYTDLIVLHEHRGQPGTFLPLSLDHCYSQCFMVLIDTAFDFV